MTPNQAKNILSQLKKQVTQREVYEALDVAIEALAWKELNGFETQTIIDYNSIEDKNVSSKDV